MTPPTPPLAHTPTIWLFPELITPAPTCASMAAVVPELRKVGAGSRPPVLSAVGRWGGTSSHPALQEAGGWEAGLPCQALGDPSLSPVPNRCQSEAEADATV